ncbi:zinc-ribbon domain-containing protein [Sphingobacterium sp.]|uniref:zinc-ribbon domain-containing protein n=1 Tax=Sphingobacterium sp. TaxID=341027 RepID=UPI00289E716A|nr:zinc-ribbon domain-containing protein [Sphingobacterium sp.]
MISIFGDKIFKGASEQLENHTCPNCNRTETTEVLCLFSYYHFFYIPIFPNSRKFITQCTDCGSIQEIKPKADSQFTYLNKKYPNPIWMWVGMPLVVILIIWIIYQEGYAK